MAVVAAVRFWAILLTLLLQSNMSHSIECYFCNNRDHRTCDDIVPGIQTYIVKCSPTVTTCSIIKGQYKYAGNRKLLMWRGCGQLPFCGQDRALCCHCGIDGCNYDNNCYVAEPMGQAKVYDKLYVRQLILLSIAFNVIMVHILF